MIARPLRRLAAPGERRLGQALRNRGIGVAKARRQVPCRAYVLDFLYAEQRRVVEVNGRTHALPLRAAAKAKRAAFLASYGIHVLRFGNCDVLGNRPGVLQVIAEALHHPHPGHLPLGEGRGEGEPAAP